VGFLDWLFPLRGAVAPPTNAPERPAFVQQLHADAAKPAAPWSDDITKHNVAIAEAYEAEVQRREALFKEGKYVARFGKVNDDGVFEPDIACDVQFEMQRTNVTNLAPRQSLLTRPEVSDARRASALRSRVDSLERAQMDPSIVPISRPSHADVLAAAGGDVARAAAVEARLDELYGTSPEAA
jgi:hypothetical protein